MTKKVETYFLGLVCAVAALLVWYAIQPGHDWGGDFAQYIQQAKYLAEGDSLQELHDWNKASLLASKEEFAPYLYPMGFPVLLSAVYAIFGMNFIAMKVFCGMFFVASIPIIYRLVKKYFDWKWGAVILTCLVAFNFQLIFHADNVLSDLPFLFFCYLSLYLMDSARSVLSLIFLGLVLFYSFFTRELGLFLLPAYGLYQFMQREKFKELGFRKFIPYAVIVLLLLINLTVFPRGSKNHWLLFFDSISMDFFWENLQFYLRLLSRSFFFGRDMLIGGIIIAMLMAFGAFYIIRRHAHFVLFTGFYVVVLLFWDNAQAARLMLPIVPLLFYFLLQGLLALGNALKVKATVALVVVVAYSGLSTTQSIKNLVTLKVESNQSYTQETRQIYSYLNAEYGDSKVIIGFEKPRVLTLFSDVKSIYTDPSHFEESIADYLLIRKDEIGDRDMIIKEFDNYVLIAK